VVPARSTNLLEVDRVLPTRDPYLSLGPVALPDDPQILLMPAWARPRSTTALASTEGIITSTSLTRPIQ
jgi:hypothetical protein